MIVRLATGAALLAVCSLTHAQYRCTSPTGSVTFQQAPCASNLEERRVDVVIPRMNPERPEHVRQAIATKSLVVGMTRDELNRVMGGAAPSQTNTTLTASGRNEQLVYDQGARTLFVYTENGVVTAIQDQQSSRPAVPERTAPRRPQRQCPTEREIRDLEIERNRAANRDKDRYLAELTRQIGEARACLQGR